jgi:hypothetical protein
VRFEGKKTMNCGEFIILALFVLTSLSGYLGWLTKKEKKQNRLIALTNR